ncbi:Homeodomain-like protein, partial [Tribonema minus]
RWTAEEDERLRKAVQRHGEWHWKLIAADVGSRDHVQCLQRWKKVLRPGLRKGEWTAAEDARLARTVAACTPLNWSAVCKSLTGRTSRQCRERWKHHLDPDLKRTEYTPDEDAAILASHHQHGNRWRQIALSVPGRTENSIKARF